jgi:putative copper export protein
VPVEFLHLIAATCDHIAQALVLMLAITMLWLVPPLSPAASVQRGRWLLVMVIIMAMCAGVDLILRTAVMADVSPDEAWGFIPRVLAHSDYGWFWQWRAGVWMVLLAALWTLWRGWSCLSAWLLLIASLVTMLLVSVTSHAGEDGLWSIVNLVNWLHLVGISLWGGAIIVYALMIMPELRQGGDVPQTVTAVARLSTLATMALVIVLLSGLFNSWHQLNGWSDLWVTPYGEVLSIKLSLVAVMMLIGALNRFYWVPSLLAAFAAERARWGSPANHLLLVLRVDSALFIAVLTLAVMLGSQSPPSHSM